MKTSIIKALRLKGGISQSQLAKVCSVHQTAVSQWEQGKTSPDIQSLNSLAEYFGVTVDYLLHNGKREETGKYFAPVLGSVRAGIPLEAIEEILDYEEITPEMANQGEHFALRITGDSMQPRICQGDIVLVRKQQNIESGDIAVVLINGMDATVKKVIKKDTSLMLVPLNNSYEPMIFSENEIESLPVSIIGKVVELRGKF